MRRCFVPAILLLASFAAAQEGQRPPAAVPETQPGPVVDATPPPGQDENTASEQRTEYSGPTILSRDNNPSVGRGENLMRLRPFLSLQGIYDTGLATASVDEQGNLSARDAYGAEANFGVLGHREWRHTALGLDYRGAFRHYSQHTYYDGMDNTLGLLLQRRISRRVTLVLQETAMRYQRGMFLPMSMDLADTTLGSMTRAELFDNPTTALASTARVIYQRTARLSMSASGTGFLARHRSQALIGADGVTATGDIAYRLSRFQTIAIQYDFNRFTFKNYFGDSYAHGIALNYSVRLGRNWELALRGGGYRLEATRQRRVELDPAIAEILGVRTGIETYYARTYLPRYDAQLTRRFRHASFSASYGRTISPGNGVYLTSATDSATVSFNYFGLSRIRLGAGFGTQRYHSILQQNLGGYRGYRGSGSFSYMLVRSLSLTANLSGYQYSVGQSSLDRFVYRASFGLTWSPGDYPVSLW